MDFKTLLGYASKASVAKDLLVYNTHEGWRWYLGMCLTAIDDCLDVQFENAERERLQMQRALVVKLAEGNHILTPDDCDLMGWEHP